LLFVLSVLAIVPLATLLSHATESVAARTGGPCQQLKMRHTGLAFPSAACGRNQVVPFVTVVRWG
jgi:hypothetical protein